MSAPVAAEKYLEGVRAILPRLRERAAQTEQLNRLPDETVADLDEAGVFIGLQPRRWGGLELDPATYFQSVVLLGSACGSTGWVGGVLGVHPWEIACMRPEAQEDVWGADPRTRASSSYAPTGKAERVAGGYRLRGRWGFSSGVDLADWALLGALVDQDGGKREHRVFLVAREHLTIDPESWQVSGLAGTGSKDVVVDGFVPEHRTHGFVELDQVPSPLPGWAINPGPLYRLRWMNVFAWGIAAPALGAATGSVEEFTRQSRERMSAFGGGVSGSVGVQLRLASARQRVESHTRAMLHTWDEQYRCVSAGGTIDLQAYLRCRYAASQVIGDSLEAALTVFGQAGGRVMDLSNPIQRLVRDLLAMRNHPMGRIEEAGTLNAIHELGLPHPMAPRDS